MLDLSPIRFTDHPFHVGFGRGVFDPADYEAMIKAYPDPATLPARRAVGEQRILTPVRDPEAFDSVVAAHPIWQRFREFVTGEGFVRRVLARLAEAEVPLDPPHVWWRRWLWRLLGADDLEAHFDFSTLPADGGHVLPHVDVHHKVVVMVLPIVAPDDPVLAHGGATEMVRSLRPDKVDWSDGLSTFDGVETVTSYPFGPNQCLMFVRRPRAWHMVRPMTGPPGTYRRALRINVSRRH